MRELFDRGEQCLNVGIGVVGGETCASSANNAESAHQGLRAMMTAAQCEATAIEIATDFISLNAVDDK